MSCVLFRFMRTAEVRQDQGGTPLVTMYPSGDVAVVSVQLFDCKFNMQAQYKPPIPVIVQIYSSAVRQKREDAIQSGIEGFQEHQFESEIECSV